MGLITLTIPVADTEITAGLHASNYNALQTLLNGNLDAANIAANAIGSSELADNAVDTAAIAALAVTNPKINLTFEAWTPTKVTQDGTDNTNIAHTVTVGRKIVLGKLVIVSFFLSFTAAGTAGNRVVIHGIPTAAGGNYVGGNWDFSDASGSPNRYGGRVIGLSTTTFAMSTGAGATGYFGTAGGGGGGITIASGDTVQGFLIYEGA